MKFLLSQIFLLCVFSCKIDGIRIENGLSNQIEFRPMAFDFDSLVGYELITENVHYGLDNKPLFGPISGVDTYKCWYEDDKKLKILMEWGSGETLTLFIDGKTFTAKANAGGCGLYESYNFITEVQRLILNNSNSDIREDSLIGYIDFEGIEDVEENKIRYEKHGMDVSYFQQHKPNVLKVKGYFRFKIFENEEDYSVEYHCLKIWQLKHGLETG